MGSPSAALNILVVLFRIFLVKSDVLISKRSLPAFNPNHLLRSTDADTRFFEEILIDPLNEEEADESYLEESATGHTINVLDNVGSVFSKIKTPPKLQALVDKMWKISPIISGMDFKIKKKSKANKFLFDPVIKKSKMYETMENIAMGKNGSDLSSHLDLLYGLTMTHKIMQMVVDYLVEEKYPKCDNAMVCTEFVFDFWTANWEKRSKHQKAKPGVSKLKNSLISVMFGEVEGLSKFAISNWIIMFNQAHAKRVTFNKINVLTPLTPGMPFVAQFNYKDNSGKRSPTLFAGTDPAFEIGVYTLCSFHGLDPCNLKIGGRDFSVYFSHAERNHKVYLSRVLITVPQE